MNERLLYQADKIILILIFGLAIYIPLFIGVMQKDQRVSSVEKRNLAQLPSVPGAIQEFMEYPSAFNQYYSDHFGLREQFTEKYFELINKFSSRSSVDDVTFGQDGWQFLGSLKPGYQGYNDPMGDAINVNLFSEKELEDFARSITTIKNWLSNRGIEYIYIIVPNKHTIYFEKLPKYITKQNKKSATDQLVQYLQEHTDVIVVDLRQVLFAEKKNHQVYFKGDTHWNHYGANVAQFEILNKIRTLFPDKISPSLLNDSQFTISTRDSDDLAGIAKIERVPEDDPQPNFEDTCLPVADKSNIKVFDTYSIECDTQELNAVIFRDSFFAALQPYISRQFHRSTYVWGKINYDSLVKYVEREKPDIVIEEVVERAFPYVPLSEFFKNHP